MSDSIYMPRATRNLEKRIVLLIVNPQFSEYGDLKSRRIEILQCSQIILLPLNLKYCFYLIGAFIFINFVEWQRHTLWGFLLLQSTSLQCRRLAPLDRFHVFRKCPVQSRLCRARKQLCRRRPGRGRTRGRSQCWTSCRSCCLGRLPIASGVLRAACWRSVQWELTPYFVHQTMFKTFFLGLVWTFSGTKISK